MRRSYLFWGIIIIVAGFLFLLDNLNILPVSAWALIWPAALIILGLWFLFGRTLFARNQVESHLAIPLEGASQAILRIDHGAGKLAIDPHSSPDQLLKGDFSGGVEHEVTRDGNQAKVRLSATPEFFWSFPWGTTGGFSWQIYLNPEVPFDLTLKTGASETRLNLTDLKITNLFLDTGASSTSISMPAHAGYTKATVHAGAASVDIRFPQNVAGLLHIQTGLAGININNTRFVQNGNTYKSPDYDMATDKVELNVEAGVGRISIL